MKYFNDDCFEMYATKFPRATSRATSEPSRANSWLGSLPILFLIDSDILNFVLSSLSGVNRLQVLVIIAEACLIRFEMTKSIIDLDHAIIEKIFHMIYLSDDFAIKIESHSIPEYSDL